MSEESPQWGGGWKISYCRASLCVICRTFITRECTKTVMNSTKGNGRLGKAVIDMPDSPMMKKISADSKAKGKRKKSTHGLLGLLMSGKGC